MAEGLVSGAVLGALFGELLKGILDLAEKSIHFKPVLEEMRGQLEFLRLVIQQLDDEHSGFLASAENTRSLRGVIEKGKKLIGKCEGVDQSILNYHKAPFYTKKLRQLDAEFGRASQNLLLQMNVQQLRRISMNGNGSGSSVLLLQKTMEKVMSFGCCCSVFGDLPNQIKLPLVFYHNKQLKGKTGPNFGDEMLGWVVEHIKDNTNQEAGQSSGEGDKGLHRRVEEAIERLGDGRFEKIFHRTFETVANEKLQNWFRCDLETEVGPLRGVLFVSTVKLAFCTNIHTPHPNLYLKVIIPFQLLKGVGRNPCDQQYIHFISVDNQKFQFINFRNYEDANKCAQQIPITLPTCTRCRLQ
ncbi:putative GEM-like protein 3, partial [Cucurbita argyrosperma subsp. sororia]